MRGEAIRKTTVHGPKRLIGPGRARAHHAAGAVGSVIGAMGIVFGDIGTSPLYAASTTFAVGSVSGRSLSPEYVYGATATIVYSLTLVVTILYVRFLMRADNQGEGGLLALFGLLRGRVLAARTIKVFTIAAMFGAAMFLGDSVITPAISVLSAVEGVEAVEPGLVSLVVPIAVVILLGVFALQRFGTTAIGKLFGPIMLIWFIVLAITGAASILKYPAILGALSPHWVVLFFVNQPTVAFFALGAIVLAVTGAEALYADLGHFGRKPISRAWLYVVFPALVLNYLGQASLVIRHPNQAGSAFFALVAPWAQLPMVILATVATIIASQSVISGAYSVIHQAWRLGLFPPLRVVHTSAKSKGQIYVPAINVMLATAVLAVTIGFQSSAALASAYGIAVTTTISITTIVYLAWIWSHTKRATPTLIIVSALLAITVTFLLANLPKAPSGGWLPLAIGAAFFIIMATWWVGQRRIDTGRRHGEMSIDELPRLLTDAEGSLHRVAGDAVFITRSSTIVPVSLITMVTQNHALQQRAILLSWSTIDVPTTVGSPERITVTTLASGIIQVIAQLGFLEQPRMAQLLTEAKLHNKRALPDFAASRAVYFISTPIPRYNRKSKMRPWAQVLFLAIDRLAPDPLDIIQLPRDRTIVLGREISL